MFADKLTIIRGAGDIATGVGWRLFRCGFPVVMTEIPEPTVVRRKVAFAEAVHDGKVTVEGVTACLITGADQVETTLRASQIPIFVDPAAEIIQRLKPSVVVDAILAKKNLGTKISDAPLVFGLGPGFTAGEDVHAVIETNRGADLGRVIWNGRAEPDTGIPGIAGGHGVERVLRSPAAGRIVLHCAIGDYISCGSLIAEVGGQSVLAPFSGTVRGLLRENTAVFSGMKIGDIDPRICQELSYTISDKALAIAGGVLEAILSSSSRDNEGFPAPFSFGG
jgi:xanthine dehydrogenase accessory factor